MKLTSSDLRIGNIVKIKDTGEIVRICAITKHKVGFHATNERPSAHLRYRRLHEIDGVRINDYWDKIVDAYNDKLELCCILREGNEVFLFYEKTYPNKKFKYIHELQNVYYALMGEELKIEL